MTLYHSTVFPIKAGLFIFINKVGNNISSNLVVYQQLIEKLIYLAYSIWPDISFVVD